MDVQDWESLLCGSGGLIGSGWGWADCEDERKGVAHHGGERGMGLSERGMGLSERVCGQVRGGGAK